MIMGGSGSGRKPQATEVAQANGTLSVHPGRRNDDLVPRSDGCAPEMPEYLDEHGQAKWDELLGDLQNMKVISSECRELMIAYCEAYSGWRRCLELVKKLGPVLPVKDEKTGKVKSFRSNPVSIELHRYRTQMNKLLPEFGLTPSSRTRLVAFKSTDESDPFITLLSRISGVN
jgi:P27 family predicted phage terminase small subunit